VNSYYLSHYATAKALVFEYTLAHILFLNSKDGATSAESRARSVREKIDKKIPFETLAAQYSEDPNFVQGGLFGTFRIGDFNKDVEHVIEQLSVTDISPVVIMADGFRIFKVLKKSLVPSPDLEAKREPIRQLLLSDNFKIQFRSWLTQKRHDAYIRLN
jgi:peptidyl-prolyl cis-trans isomerase SurA